MLSVFFSSVAGFSVGVTTGAGLPEKEKPANGLGLVSVFVSLGFSVGVTAGAVLLNEKPPKAGLFSPALGVPKSPGPWPSVGVTPAPVATLVVVSDCPLVCVIGVVTGAVVNLGGENENGALDTTVSVEEDGRVNEKAGLAAPNENPEELVVAGIELGVPVVPKPVEAVDAVAPNAGVEAGAVTGAVVKEKPKVGATAAVVTGAVVDIKPKVGAAVATGAVVVEKPRAGAADEVGTPNFIPVKELDPAAGVDANENPVLAGAVVVTVVVLKPAAGVVGATDVAGGMPNFI